ncbi:MULTISPECIES: (Fe-S)-binding protein [unclassified Rhizobacter]|uniref:(Fe-S)-binding protein n=1 Tax=unclassified Rhizobacter TaxID=2640088 RepID=UPI0006F96644|nr:MULTISPECIES: heterodisulfide reductase-related iron-sulfur binding cluster [unclassified Rhizobacter]KQU71126.1 Fe-S oxidoreductase [Rhizobacter sp. Root29]KQW03690.1 Fe-S oxidoreductase [Rhizobacter sp. Root1238]KRB16066.1 Fe-S oxidoreductase [Rhizobacter sp. Root16D2]
MTREGNLEAPTRHPVDWKNPSFHDEGACLHEMERVFDICHGCRRCVSLCQSFPTLFDLIDNSSTGEVDGVAKADYAKVVDQCYLCDLCYMTKCPYVPPHPWNLDFPHTMLRAKAIKFKRGGVGAGERFLASTDVHGQFAGIPVVVQVANALNRTKPMRRLLDTTLHVHPEAWLPDLAASRFRWSADKRGAATRVTNGERTPGKVAIFSTCYVNYNEPGIGHDLLKVLAHNDIPYEIVDKESCCGMPKLELGDLDAVARHKEANVPVLARYAKDGFAILSAIPSCTLMFKQELPLLFPDDADVTLVQQAMFDPFEYLVARHKDGLLKTDFKQPLGKVSYHVPCHGRVQKIGRKTEELLKLIGQAVTVQLNTVERCSGHAGTYGVKTPTHPVAMKIGRPVFKAMAANGPDYISSDCALAGHHIAQGMAQQGAPAATLAHPLSLVRIAYGL